MVHIFPSDVRLEGCLPFWGGNNAFWYNFMFPEPQESFQSRAMIFCRHICVTVRSFRLDPSSCFAIAVDVTMTRHDLSMNMS